MNIGATAFFTFTEAQQYTVEFNEHGYGENDIDLIQTLMHLLPGSHLLLKFSKNVVATVTFIVGDMNEC